MATVSCSPAGPPLAGDPAVTALVDRLNTEYLALHRAYEDNFWSTKMGLSGSSSAALASSKSALDEWLSSDQALQEVQAAQTSAQLSEEQRRVLAVMRRTFETYVSAAPEVSVLRDQLNRLEATLAERRRGMPLGYTDSATGHFHSASAVQLRNAMKMSPGEADRKAAYDALCTIGPFVADDFCEIVKVRNRLAAAAGFANYYDMKVQAAEGFTLQRLFEMLDGLETASRPLMADARRRLADSKGPDALQAWNMSHALVGDVEARLDLYFPFEDAVDVWSRTFAALGIDYRGSTMQLDLCDRQGKYSNGFCHWPVPAFRQTDGCWVAAQANFTSLASPGSPGSGRTALVTLLHEGGHAAHFANVDQRSPLCSQERAPTSVAYAENQSMLLDSLADDAAWLARYARDAAGSAPPWELVRDAVATRHPYAVLQLRAMLAVPYFERALYELTEEDVTPARILELAAETECQIEGGAAPRPLMSVPHILSDESSAYYHGYVLAEMGVHQAREHFIKTLGGLVDEPGVGKALTEAYWKPGNTVPFLDLVEGLTGKPLSADAWVHELRLPTDEKIAQERAAYNAALRAGPKFAPGEEVQLNMRIRLVDGDDVIADTEQEGGSLTAACAKFKAWLARRPVDKGAAC